MHIAICDDDIAHRKHFERLMKRESDSRSVIDSPLYIDSFGSEEALFYAPMQYDMFFISVSKLSVTALDLVSQLRHINVIVPIAVIKTEDAIYPAETEEKDVYFISDPLKPSELHQMVEIAHSFSKNATHLYEIHGVYETKYLSEEMILYADVRENGKYTLHLTDGSKLDCDMPLLDFYYIVINDPAFVDTGKNAVINLRYLKKMQLFKLELHPNIVLPISLSERKRILAQQEIFLTKSE